MCIICTLYSRSELDERATALMQDLKVAKNMSSAVSKADVRDCIRVLEREWPALVQDSESWQKSIDDALSGMKALEKDMHTFASR